MHPLRPYAPVARASLGFDDEGEAVLRFDDGRVERARSLPTPFEGFELLRDLVEDPEEEAALLQEMEAWPWRPSQSGRWKQDFGPKANFKKRLVKVPEDWQGLPSYAHRLLRRLRARCGLLGDFDVAEFLSLLYDPDEGANHALHVDDVWLWGERIVGVSLRGAATFTFYDPVGQIEVRVPLPRRSAYVLSGAVRFKWQHGILDGDIESPRVALTFRELTPEIAATEQGQVALARAQGLATAPATAASRSTL